VLPSLVEACGESGQTFVLVLDDAHLVSATRSQMVSGYLGERLAAGCQLVLATRTDGRHRARRSHGRRVRRRATAPARRHRTRIRRVPVTSRRCLVIAARKPGWTSAQTSVGLGNVPGRRRWFLVATKPEPDRNTRTHDAGAGGDPPPLRAIPPDRPPRAGHGARSTGRRARRSVDGGSGVGCALRHRGGRRSSPTARYGADTRASLHRCEQHADAPRCIARENVRHAAASDSGSGHAVTPSAYGSARKAGVIVQAEPGWVPRRPG
jgi:hypothetical protein